MTPTSQSQSSFEELDYIASHETTPIVVAQAALRAKAHIEALEQRIASFESALAWAEDHDPWLVEQIRERAALREEGE